MWAEPRVIGGATASPRVGWVVMEMTQCDCPHCHEGEHPTGNHISGWFATKEEAEAAIKRGHR